LEKKKTQSFSQLPKGLMDVMQGQGPNKISKKSVGEILKELDSITGSRQETIKILRPLLNTLINNNKADFDRAANDMTGKFYTGLFGPEVISAINEKSSIADPVKLGKLKDNRNIKRMIQESIKQISTQKPKFPVSPEAIAKLSPAIAQAAAAISSNVAQISPTVPAAPLAAPLAAPPAAPPAAAPAAAQAAAQAAPVAAPAVPTQAKEPTPWVGPAKVTPNTPNQAGQNRNQRRAANKRGR